MSLEEYWHSVLTGHERGLKAALVRGLCRVAGGGMWLGLQANLSVYRLGLRKQIDVGRPVVVIGNLTLGGTGKTTATTYLVRRLAEDGVRAGVILRGYRRESGPPPLLVSDGAEVLAEPAQAGDEAYLLASLLPGHPVAVGVRREKVARMVLDQTEADAFVLDDGFQYFRLARTADVVLVDASHEIETDRMCPAGTLREPHGHLRRAAQVWVTHAELASPERVAALKAWVEQTAPGMPVAVTEHRVGRLRTLAGAKPTEGARVLAMSGLGNPLSFHASLARLGYDVHPLTFPDHHRYTPDDWQEARSAAEQANTEHTVTTEKDAVKLPPPPPEVGSVHVLGCELAVVEGGRHIDALVETVKTWP